MLFIDMRGRKGRGKRMLVRRGEKGGEKKRREEQRKGGKMREKDKGESDLSGGKKRDERFVSEKRRERGC